MRTKLMLLAVALPLAGAAASDDETTSSAEHDAWLGLPPEWVAPALAAPAEQVELGRRLFFEPSLSRDRSLSCASCHQPEHGFSDPRPISPGVEGRMGERNTPTLYNRAFGKSFMWDGRFPTLEAQVLQPIVNPVEMDLSVADALARLTELPEYAAAFEQVFGGPPSEEFLAAALANFVRRQLHGGTAVDHFRGGEHDALTPEERAGMWFFESRGGCWRCHGGENFTDEEFHNTGVGAVDGKAHFGRAGVTGEPTDLGKFKTPTLRGLTETGPYMHDGSLATLEEVVEHYKQGGIPNEALDSEIVPLEMRDADAANLVAFLKALSRR